MPKGDIREWLAVPERANALCEVVLRAKAIEANQLHSAGPDAEVDYLLAFYEGDEDGLRALVVQVVNMLASYVATRDGKVKR